MKLKTDIDSLIEFVLRHADDIRTCVAQKREENNGHGHTGGGSTGHMRISDPTALEAIRAVEPILYIYCPYGIPINGKRDERYVPKPEKWLLVEAATRKRYHENCKDFATKHVYERRYLWGDCPQNWRETCISIIPPISRGTYYAIRADILHFAARYASGMGIISPYAR